jgi:uncharacterized membrane-anchored protein YhcB (DUF1043 family)
MNSEEKVVFSFTILLIVATAAFAVGCLLTLLMTRTLSSSEQKTRDLETRLQQAEENMVNYQQQVTEHFSETAQLVNNLTQSYKEVHEHLTGSALKLANVDISRQLLSTNITSGSNEELPIADEDFEPPKDWAPSDGTLSESYGLVDEDELPANLPPQHK